MSSPYAEIRLQLALDAAQMEIWDSSVIDSNILSGDVFWTNSGATLLGLPAVPPIQSFQAFLQHVHPDDRQGLVTRLQEAVDIRADYTVEYRIIWPDGEIRWLGARAKVYTTENGLPVRTLGVIWDITDKKFSANSLFEQKELAEVTLGSIADGVITTDGAGVITYMNRIAETLTGWPFAEAEGQPVAAVFRVAAEQGRLLIENSVTRCLLHGATSSMGPRGILLARGDRHIDIEDSAAPIRDKEGAILGVVLVFHDVSHEQRLRHELSWQATHDSLTGLINRREFETQVGFALASARDEPAQHALLFLDLDQFKIVNDTSGHAAGDALLRQLAHLLQGRMRENDLLSRLGGDELGVLLRYCSLGDAVQMAESLRQCVRDFRFVWEERSFEIGVSIGLAEIEAGSKSLSDILSAADRACYVAKEHGRNRVHVFRESDVAIARRFGEMMWVARLNEAFEKENFRLYGQPIIKLGNGSLSNGGPSRLGNDRKFDQTGGRRGHTHLEILVRMSDENDGIVLPDVFIPAAERYDLMPTLDRWVIRNTFQHIRQRRLDPDALDSEHVLPAYAINLSGASLNDDRLMDYINLQFDEFSVRPDMICFEITETAAIGNLIKARMFMQEVKKRGCRFALDDFGSGLSSFSHLKNLPVDFLKIDGSFVREMATDPVIRAMVASINQVGHVMGIETIAEYVENEAILQQVQDIGIDYAQGFAVGRPEPLNRWIEQENQIRGEARPA